MADTATAATRTTSVERLDEDDRFELEGLVYTVVENLGEVDENDEARGIVTVLATCDRSPQFVCDVRMTHGPVDVLA